MFKATECSNPIHKTPPTIHAGEYFCPYCGRHRFLKLKRYQLVIIGILFLVLGIAFGIGISILVSTETQPNAQEIVKISTGTPESEHTIQPTRTSIETAIPTNTPTHISTSMVQPTTTQQSISTTTATRTVRPTITSSPNRPPTRTLMSTATQRSLQNLNSIGSNSNLMSLNHCQNALPSRLIPQETARVLSVDDQGVNLRSGPNSSNDKIMTVPAGGSFQVLEGPHCNLGDEHPWYRVTYNEQEGWLAESDLRGYYTEPAGSTRVIPPNVSCSGAPAPRLVVDEFARVELTNDPLLILTRPGYSSQTIKHVYPNEQFLVIGGPICSANKTGSYSYWWLLRIESNVTGWANEGVVGNYYLGPIN